MKHAGRPQLRAGRYKQKAEILRYTQNGSDQYGQPIYIWKKLKEIRCFIDGTAGIEWFNGDMVFEKETFYFEFRHTDVLMRDTIRFIDKRGRVLNCNLTSVYEDEIAGKYIRALGYVLSADEQTLPPEKLTGVTLPAGTTPVTPPANAQTPGGIPPATDHKIPKPYKITGDNQKVKLYFNMPIEITGDIKKAFRIRIDGNEFTPTAGALSTDPKEDNVLILDIDEIILKSAKNISLSYLDTLPGVEVHSKSDTSQRMENQTYPVDNISLQEVADVIPSACYIPQDGKKVHLTFDAPITYIAGDYFDLVVDGTTYTIGGAGVITDNFYALEIPLSFTVYQGSPVAIKYHFQPEPDKGLYGHGSSHSMFVKIKDFAFTVANNSTVQHVFPTITGSIDARGIEINLGSPSDIVFGSLVRNSINITAGKRYLHPAQIIGSGKMHVLSFPPGTKFYKGEKVTITYNPGGATDDYKIKDQFGDYLRTGTVITVNNSSNVPAPVVGTHPRMSKAVIVSQSTIEVTYDQPIHLKDNHHSTEWTVPGAFFLAVGAKPGSETTITLRNMHKFNYGDAVILSYKGTSLVGKVGGLTAPDQSIAVTNNLPKPVVPFSYVSGTTTNAHHIELIFTEDIDTIDATAIMFKSSGTDDFGAPINREDVADKIDISGKSLIVLMYNVPISSGLTLSFKITKDTAIVSKTGGKLKVGTVYPIKNTNT